MKKVTLGSLRADNPLGLLCALGALDGAARQLEHVRRGAGVKLAWSVGGAPRPVLSGVDSAEELVELLDRDRLFWQSSLLLKWSPERDGAPLGDLNMPPDVARQWVREVGQAEGPGGAAQLRLLSGLLAEGGVDQSRKKVKPSHLDFTAGQQRFLQMARQLATGVDASSLHDALFGSWRSTSPLPVFGWDVSGERVYAYRAADPSGEKKEGVPGANWLAFVGLSYFPVFVKGGQVVTTACSPEWKSSHLTWPVWTSPTAPSVVRSLLRDASLLGASEKQRSMRGVKLVLRSPIRRTDQGGYGSFGAPEALSGDAGKRAGPALVLVR